MKNTIIIFLVLVIAFLSLTCIHLASKAPRLPLSENEVHVKWVKFNNLEDVRFYCRDTLGANEKPGYSIKACATFDLEKHTCTIYAVEPNPEKQLGKRMTYFGHELYHCFAGAFHK